MNITQITLKNFRCFENLTLSLESRVVVIHGLNGVGKTSLLEALHYACYLRSFRTYSPTELTRSGNDSFFIKVGIINSAIAASHEIQVGFAGKRRLVKVDQQSIVSYKQLLDYYRIITLTEDDLDLIKDGPEIRRTLLDQFILMMDPDYLIHSKKLKHVVENRNALLKSHSYSQDSYAFWGEELWNVTALTRQARITILEKLERSVQALIATYLSDRMCVSFEYQPKKETKLSYAEFMATYPRVPFEEGVMKRSLFGAHLDDFAIRFQEKKSRIFASRGQQKLIVMLIKIAQIQLLMENSSTRPIFLLDDFMTDFDPINGRIIMNLLQTLGCQLIFTCPSQQGWLYDSLQALSSQQVSISN